MTTTAVSRKGIAYTAPANPARDKPWAALCHGAWLQGACWTQWRAALAGTFNVLSFDVPGYGGSALSDSELQRRGPYDWSGYVLSLLDELAIERAYMIGESTGGAAVLHAAATHRERVIACAVCSTPYRGDVLRPVTGRFPEVWERAGLVGLADYMLEHLFLADDDGKARESIRSLLLACRPEVPMHDAAAWRTADFTEVARSVSAPVLVLAPGSSAFITREHAFELEALLADPHLMLFGRAGHYFTFAHSELLAGIVRDFFAHHQDRQG